VNQPAQQDLNAGVRLLQEGRIRDAQRLSRALLERFPDSHEALVFAADTASLGGDRGVAIDYISAAVERAPDNWLILLRKAQLEFNDSRRADALTTARAVAEHIEDDEKQYRAIARIFSDCLDIKGARELLLKAHRALPDSVPVLADLATAEFHLNLADDAEQHIETLLQMAPFHPAALHLRSSLRTQTAEQNHVADLTERLARGPDHPNLVAGACYALAKEYEDLGHYPEAYEVLTRGAKAFRSTLTYDSADELAAHADIREAFTPEAFESLPPGNDGEGPIFVIGMPRTGTTLVERLLGSHSQVCSIGEFTDFPMLLSDQVGRADRTGATGNPIELSLKIDFAELGGRYLKAARELAGDSPFFVDKLPVNFLYCGYIRAALPRARLIHLGRDPLDTCYAVYKTLFLNAYSFSYDLDELADYVISYHRQMRHWHEVMPGHILDVSYETLVRDPEPEARRILDWCGLEWEPDVLDFHKQETPSMTASAMQVRRPFYTESIGAWQRAGSEFDSLRKKLEAAGLLSTDRT
jgi:tetratricopeptide (TPR) repeat protein